MTNYREILRLDSIGLNRTEIAASCGCSRNTVAGALKRAAECGLSWPLPADMTDQQLAGILYPSAAGKPEYKMPDYEYVYREMQRKGVTLNLLWLEYVEKCRLSGDVPYQSTQFNKYYGEYVAKHSATMHLNHKPGEIMQVDWAGDTAEVIDNITGEILDVYVFVAVLPYSGYGYVEGSFSMNQECWTAAHVNAFRYFGGVTRILQCDNLKTGVERHGRNEVTLNKSYQELKVILLLQNYPRHLPGTAQAKSKILKHLAIKKKDYSDIQQYLIFKCEEGTHRPLRDETGHMIQRDFFIQSGMNCNAFTFDAECVKLNHQFHKNNHKGDIMAHHFIISFDPRDAADHGLTPHKAHALSKEFAKYFFAGHQALIVTHADGNNHAGNIHTHIVINSLRKEKVEWRSFMENPRDCLPGYKHHLTDALLHRMHERLGEICEREHLYTVEINQPTDKKVTDREYQAQRREQKSTGSPAAETIKQKIRDAVDDAASRAGTELEFFNILRRDYSIRLNLKRGRYSYVHPDSEKPYTARSLDNAFSREVILEKLRVNRQPVVDDRPEFAGLPRVFLIHSDLRLIVDLQSCVKLQRSFQPGQQSRAYAQKVTISNIQKMADTVSWLEKNKMNSLDQLTTAKRNLEDRYYDAENDLRHVKNELIEVNQKIKHVGRYLTNKKVYAQYQAAENRDAFRAEYRSQIEAYEESLKALDELFMGDDFPSLKDLKERKAELIEKRDRLQAEYKPLAAEMRNMKVVWKNVCYILGRQAELEKEEQRELMRPVPEQPLRPRKRRREMSL